MRFNILLNRIEKINKFLGATQSFESGIDLIKGSYIIDAKSLLGVYSMDLSKPVMVEIHSVDDNELKMFKMTMEEFKVDEGNN